jgi:hypothetical protein
MGLKPVSGHYPAFNFSEVEHARSKTVFSQLMDFIPGYNQSKPWLWGRSVMEISLNHGCARPVAAGLYHRIGASVIRRMKSLETTHL